MKKGFTLAEVLITLGIIGVVAALTAPALVQNAGNAKVGPTLSKVVSTLENANRQILNDQEASDLSKLSSDNYEASTGPSGTLPYMELLSQYIAGSSIGSTTQITTSNTKYFNPAWTDYHGTSLYHNVYIFNFSNNITLLMLRTNTIWGKKGSYKGAFIHMWVDINGNKVKPNAMGKDLFYFFIDKSGSVVPEGSTTWKWLKNDDKAYWDSEGTDLCNETGVGRGWGCSGSIFDNNLKVIYQ